MASIISSFTIHTKRRHEFITITDDIERIIAQSGVKNGCVVVQTLHTTAGIWVNEDEKNLIGKDALACTADIHRVMDRFASPEEEYHHNDIKDMNNPHGKRDTHLCEPDSCGLIHECINGHSHAQSLLIPHSITMIVENGKLVKGRWQEIMLVELDHDRQRTVKVLVWGE